jgi:predicted kinase
MDTRTKFIHWYNDVFKTDPLYLAMENTVEDSPWHRERNVGIHTDMVVSQYLSTSDPFDVRGAIGCAFHDVGKPPAEIERFKPERGTYRAYYGHELLSARMWEDFAVKNWTFLSEHFGLVPDDIYTIGWMIEHHVPWATKKDAKLDAFAATAYKTLGFDETWANMLMADQSGRISDDSHQRLEQCNEWIDDHFERVRRYFNDVVQPSVLDVEDKKFVFMLIGAPGTGKSTARNNIGADATICMDDLRLEWYDTDYDKAFKMSTEDKKFGHKVEKLYIEALNNHNTVVLDNTNTSAKQRRRWLAPAKARGFQLVAVVFPVDLDTVLARQNSRTDKKIPDHVVVNMYNRLSLPMYGEFDKVLVDSSNL